MKSILQQPSDTSPASTMRHLDSQVGGMVFKSDVNEITADAFGATPAS